MHACARVMHVYGRNLNELNSNTVLGKYKYMEIIFRISRNEDKEIMKEF